MINVNDIFGQPEYAWAVPVAFSFVILFNIFTGIFKGWKSSLYYVGWNIVILVIGVFATKPIIKLALENIDTSGLPIDLQGFLNDHKAIVPIVMVAWFLVLIPIAFLIKLPFRKKLKLEKPIKPLIRIGGISISAVGSLPLAIFAANATTLASGSTDFSPFVDAMVNGFTFGQYDGVSKYVDEIKNVLDLVDNGGIDKIADIFNPSATNPINLSPENHQQIQDLLNGPSVPSLLENAQGDLLDKLDKFKPTDASVFTDYINNNPSFEKFNVDASNANAIGDILVNKYNWDKDVWEAFRNSFLNIR